MDRHGSCRALSVFLAAHVLLLRVGLAGEAAAADSVQRYPSLVTPGAWQPLPAETEARLSPAGTHLELAFTTGKPVRLMLREPVGLPDEVRDLSFLATNNGDNCKVRVHVLIRDADGLEHVFNTRSDLKVKSPEGEYGMTYRGHRSIEVRHHTPGLSHQDIRRNIRPAKPNRQPRRPFTWLGLLIESRAHSDPRHPPRGPRLYLADFTVSSLTANESDLYYQFCDRECFGEIDGLPYLTPGQFWWWPGTYRIAWDVRDRFSGQPFLFGGTKLVASKDGDTSLAVQLARHIEIPVREKGVYWVTVRIRRTDEHGRYKWYGRVEQFEYRLDVLEGDSAPKTRSVGPRSAYHFIRIASEQENLVYEAGEELRVPVQVFPPKGDAFTLKLEARSSSRGDVVFTAEGGAGEVNAFDLSDQPPGGYVVQATLIDGEGQPFDVARRLVVRRDPNEEKLAPIPDSVPHARDLLARDEPMFHLDATYYTPQRLANPAEAWEEGFKPFLDEAGTLSRDLEITIYWRLAEPVPGVYDWGETDRFLDYAQAKGLRVLLRLDFRGPSVPEWLPGRFVRTREGHAFGHTAYLFHGMQPNFFFASELRRALARYQLAAVRHFRGHPAVQGYYWVAEHPGDAPWSGFFGGYSAESITGFGDYLRQRQPKLEWDTGSPPDRDADPRLRLAWLRYRQDAVDSATREFVTRTRGIDPKRLLMVYATRRDAAWFAERGCMTANGGTHDGLMPGYLGMALDGFQMRNEEISPRFWSGTGPYQLDATVFHATYAGGIHTHCKAFIATWKRFADCWEPKRSLGKYKDFQRIWRELRQTEAMPTQAFAFVDEGSFLLEVNSVGVTMTPGGWPVQEFHGAHLPVALARHEHWRKGKLLLATGQYVEHLASNTIEQLVAYVSDGGCLYMRADAGRHCLERPDEDWVLLRRLGFPPPAGDLENDRYRQATAPKGQQFRLRDGWKVEPIGETLATFVHNQAPALSRLSFGKGRVIVRWSQCAVPPPHGGGHSILADIADLAGVRRHALADHPRLWTHLLKHRRRPTWYALVYAGPWHRPIDSKPVTGRVWWSHLPEGSYRITELIHQRDLGMHAGEALRAQGLPVRLAPREVNIWRLERIDSLAQ